MEWKHREDECIEVHHAALKPSLVEWKRIHRALKNETQNALKPSLVEWKLLSAAARALARRPP